MNKFAKYLADSREEPFIIVLFAGLVGALVLLAWLAVVEQRDWNVFAAQHHCVVFGHSSGSVDSAGHYTRGKIGYRCDDGMEYWR